MGGIRRLRVPEQIAIGPQSCKQSNLGETVCDSLHVCQTARNILTLTPQKHMTFLGKCEQYVSVFLLGQIRYSMGLYRKSLVLCRKLIRAASGKKRPNATGRQYLSRVYVTFRIWVRQYVTL